MRCFPLSMRNVRENQLMFNLTFSVRISRFATLQSDVSPFKYIVRHTLASQLSLYFSMCDLQQRLNLKLRQRRWHLCFIFGKQMFRIFDTVRDFSYVFSGPPRKSWNTIALSVITSRPLHFTSFPIHYSLSSYNPTLLKLINNQIPWLFSSTEAQPSSAVKKFSAFLGNRSFITFSHCRRH